MCIRKRINLISEPDSQAAVNFVRSTDAIDGKDKEWNCRGKSKHDPDELQARIGGQQSCDSGVLGEETNIEFIKGGKANDDVGMGTLRLDVAKENGEADEDINEEDVCR
jgi:hypothetical protein